MIETKEIENLAELSRLELSAKEKASLQKDLGGILDYISELKKVTGGGLPESQGEAGADTALVRNVMRADDNAHESGIFTEDLLKVYPDMAGRAPRVENGYVVVKKIL